uniref:BOS complex subunit TMEM147 n=1 Tax=Poecilia latipinna TaxID=48699 RepID=A0A3B3U0M7_9TELE
DALSRYIFPNWEGAGVYDFVREFMKSTVDLADRLGLHLVMSRNAGKGEHQITVAAVGWATAELVMSRLVVHYIAMAAVVWMFTRYDLPMTFRLPVTVLLPIFCHHLKFFEFGQALSPRYDVIGLQIRPSKDADPEFGHSFYVYKAFFIDQVSY